MRGYDAYDHAYEHRRRGQARGYDRHWPAGRDPWTGWYPGAFWGGPMFGWGGMEAWGWPPYAPVGYGRAPQRRRPPRYSATYGRGGDRALRRWAERYGYDFEFSVRPR